jgi:hypothetical protein
VLYVYAKLRQGRDVGTRKMADFTDPVVPRVTKEKPPLALARILDSPFEVRQRRGRRSKSDSPSPTSLIPLLARNDEPRVGNDYRDWNLAESHELSRLLVDPVLHNNSFAHQLDVIAVPLFRLNGLAISAQ